MAAEVSMQSEGRTPEACNDERAERGRETWRKYIFLRAREE